MTKQTAVTSRDPKGRRAVGIFETAYDRARLDDDHAQWLNKDCRAELLVGISELITALSNRYDPGEVRTDCTYPQTYKGPKPINEQIAAIADTFGLRSAKARAYAKRLPRLPKGAEGWFAVPALKAVTKKYSSPGAGAGDAYCRAVRCARLKIGMAHQVASYHDEPIRPGRMRISEQTVRAEGFIAAKQPGDILIIAAQLGERHRGRSVLRARTLFARNEFGLTSLAASAILMVHPERFAHDNDLSMDCSGEDFNDPHEKYRRFEKVLSFSFNNGALDFRGFLASHSYCRSGPVSGFIPR